MLPQTSSSCFEPPCCTQAIAAVSCHDLEQPELQLACSSAGQLLQQLVLASGVLLELCCLPCVSCKSVTEQHGGHIRPLLLALRYRSIAETFCPADFVELIHNKKGEREGWTVYGFTKMANIWMAKVPAACSSAALACAYSRQHGY